MNKDWVLWLFPRAWRERYEKEFQALLEEYDPSAADTLDILKAAGDAQLRYRQLPEGVPVVAGGQAVSSVAYWRARTRVRLLASLYADLVLFVLVNLLLLGINLLTTPETLWFVWPLWGWGMFLAVHAICVLRGRERFVAHLALFATLNIGLIWINLVYSDVLCFPWPLAATATLLVAHALVAFHVTGYFGAHVAAYGLGLAQIAAAVVAYPEATYELVTVGITWTIVLLCHALVRFSGFSLLKAHILLFAGIGGQLIAQNLMRADEIWFHYVLFAWAVILAAHIAIEAGWISLFDSGWKECKERELTTLAGLAPNRSGNVDEAEALDAIARRVRSLRVLYMHAFVFGVGAAALLVLNILTYTAGPWVLWPLWGWVMVFAAHTGWVLTRRGLFGAHLMLFLTVNTGLIAIDLIYGDEIWFYWVLAGTALLLGIHFLFTRETLRALREWESRQIASIVE